jgi:hypothetical protein
MFVFFPPIHKHDSDADTFEAVLRASGSNLHYIYIGCSNALYTTGSKEKYQPPRDGASHLCCTTVQILASTVALQNTMLICRRASRTCAMYALRFRRHLSTCTA